MSVSNLRRQARYLDPEAGRVPISEVVKELSGAVTFDVEMRAFDEDPWAVKVPRFNTAEDAWGYINGLIDKPVYAGCRWQVVEVHRMALLAPRRDGV